MSMNLTVTTFHEKDQWVDAFMKAEGLRLLFLVGNPGQSKSNSIETRLDHDQHRYIKCGRLTAFQLYKQLFSSRNKAIILDDVEDALKRYDTARILMNLCETDEKARTVAWFGTESQLSVRKGKKTVKIPQEFDTSSRVCLVSNDWDILLGKFQALLDRGTVLFFDPSPEEVHAFVGKWFAEPEIYDFISNRLDDIPQHSIRYYVIAKEHKLLGLDWKKALLESWTHDSDQIDAERAVEMILAGPSYKTDKERIEAFTAKTGRQRRQWYNLKKKVLKRKPGIGYSLRSQPSVLEEPSQSSNRSAPQDDIDLSKYEPEVLPK